MSVNLDIREVLPVGPNICLPQRRMGSSDLAESGALLQSTRPVTDTTGVRGAQSNPSKDILEGREFPVTGSVYREDG